MILIEIAKSAVEKYIKEGETLAIPENIPKEFLEKKAGTFVTIEKGKELRGCIGTYLPTQENIVLEIINNAIAAATEDYRFNPITKEELSLLSYTVYILGEPELVANIGELDPKKYGIIVKTVPITSSPRSNVMFNGYHSSKTGLLLPDLEGVDTKEKQIFIACQKAGIDPEKEEISIYRFEAEKYQ